MKQLYCYVAAVAALMTRGVAAQDVLLETQGGGIVVGAVDDETFEAELGVRVFRGEFLPNLRANEPGFLSFAYGNSNMPAGVDGFPALQDVDFDLLPMTMGQASANLFFWNGGGGVDFARPAGVAWRVLNGSAAWISADGGDALVPGGLIQRTSSDIDPLDGVNSGAMHKHLVLELNDGDQDALTSPAAGVYMIAWQVRSAGFATSEPFLFVHGTSTVPAATIDAAAAWAEANYDRLVAPVMKGDFDGDGGVDGDDFLAWQRTLGSAAVPPGSGADGDVSGVIDAGDLAAWRVGMSGGAVVPAPEPSGVVLVGVAATVGGLTTEARRTRRKRKAVQCAERVPASSPSLTLPSRGREPEVY